ncbi:MAG: S-formylglutathione hydrolase [Gammaproteobacteria bacterium]|nr:S-formylglutathione hydrolase [Gammaproteobacteria bacterium]MDP6617002.1 S-formylglutathione hydrolase [Gammaproteobacteria bacterium]MDP6695106.1 S-formylglutathione hydrolase [Gammaproteobacteria bacterium]
MKTAEEHRCFAGRLAYVSHESAQLGCAMRFSIYLPDAAASRKLPVMWWLSGLTCTEDNFTVKAGAYRAASENEIIIVVPDTSPRGEDIPDDEAYDLGQGAGFYLDATESPWSDNFRMYSYITDELQALVIKSFPVDPGRQAISGHSMGGHGALTIALRNASRYRSVSAFAPIVAPMQCPWGDKAFRAYLGDNPSNWKEYDATELMLDAGDRNESPEILVDVGLADPFLDEQLKPDLFAAACNVAGQPLRLRKHEGHDHSYFLIASFIEEHIRFHAAQLGT